jgi:hypothetical protein
VRISRPQWAKISCFFSKKSPKKKQSFGPVLVKKVKKISKETIGHIALNNF